MVETIKDSNGNITGPGMSSDQMNHALFPRVYATGSFMGPNRIVSAVAKDGCTPRSYGVGDQIVVTLAQAAAKYYWFACTLPRRSRLSGHIRYK